MRVNKLFRPYRQFASLVHSNLLEYKAGIHVPASHAETHENADFGARASCPHAGGTPALHELLFLDQELRIETANESILSNSSFASYGGHRIDGHGPAHRHKHRNRSDDNKNDPGAEVGY